MNWGRGLWRLWIAASILWIGFWIWERDVPCALPRWGLPNWGCGISDMPPHAYVILPRDTFPLMLGVPLLVLAAGYVIRWIVMGLRSPR
jgi:hypothetical protein